MPQSPLYESDFYAWANEQAALLRQGKLAEADIEHIADEIEGIGKTEKRELISHLTILIQHLLKWRYQPERRSRSWRLSIQGRRLDINAHLADNPSLKNKLDEAIAHAYRRALIEAQRETNLDADAFPPACPWAYDQMIAEDFWPNDRA